MSGREWKVGDQVARYSASSAAVSAVVKVGKRDVVCADGFRFRQGVTGVDVGHGLAYEHLNLTVPEDPAFAQAVVLERMRTAVSELTAAAFDVLHAGEGLPSNQRSALQEVAVRQARDAAHRWLIAKGELDQS